MKFFTDNIFEATRKKREAQVDKSTETQPSAPAQGTPSQSDFFYSTPSELRKKKTQPNK